MEGDASEDVRTSGAKLFAVFCTADIPCKTLNKFISESRVRAQDIGFLACIFDSNKPFTEYTHGTQLPVQPFRSPFLNLSLEEIDSYFRTSTANDESGHHANCTYIVLDQDTITEGTCCCISILHGPAQRMRSDFYMALELLGAPELAIDNFDDGAFSEFYEDGELFTLEKMQALQERWAIENELRALERSKKKDNRSSK